MSQLEDELNAETKALYTVGNGGFANCHRTGSKPNKTTEDYNGSDQDSGNSKEVVPEDNRERQDGPGGN